MFDYDSWLESPYTNERESHTHPCGDCDGEGKLWIEDVEKFSDIEPCPKCEEGEIECFEDVRDCFGEPERDDD